MGVVFSQALSGTSSTPKQVGCLFPEVLFPLVDLGRMDGIFPGQFGNGLQFLQRFQRDLGLELGTMLFPRLGHVVTSVSVDSY